MPWTDAEHDYVLSRHAALMALVDHPTVPDLVAGFVRDRNLRAFLKALFAVPEIHAAVLMLDSGAVTAVSALVAGVSGPLGVVTGPAAGALVALGLHAIERHLESTSE